MKPLGTITIFYPYVDEKTRDTLELVMNEAKDFGDFTERLCDRVISEPSTPLLEYLAFLFANRIENSILIDRLDVAGKVTELARPIIQQYKITMGTKYSWSDVKASLMAALSAAPNDWIATNLYLFWRIDAELYFAEADAEVRSLDIISAAVSENSEMGYFESWLLRIAARKYEKGNEIDKQIALLRQALALARKFDDKVAVVSILVKAAGMIKHTDLQKAIDMLVTAKELGKELGYRNLISVISHHMGHIMGMRGEYDAAVEYQCEYKESQKTLGRSQPIHNAFVAMYYNLSGNEAKALKFSEEVFATEVSDLFIPWARAQQAWALISLGKYAEAQEVIETLNKQLLKSGETGQVVWYYIVEGLLDKAEGRFENSVMNFQKALDYNVEGPVPIIKNICLPNLTEIEIDKLTDTAIHENHDSSGHWMTKLEEYVQQNDFPGISAQALILRAKLRYRQRKYDEVRRILKEVQEIGNRPSMRYLNNLIITKFPDMIVR
ncbi:MAG: hypothetical protein ACFFF4_09005 [Candidatus Thorarchaeota archaeon]